MLTDEEMMMEGDIARRVSTYSVVVGFLMLVVFVVPCIVLALVAKYMQKRTPSRRTSNRSARGSLRLFEEKINENNVGFVGDSDSSGFGTFSMVEIPANKLVCIERIALLKHGLSCINTWKAHAPSVLLEGCSDSCEKIVAVRKLAVSHNEATSRENHSSCLKTELSSIAHIPSNHVILNLLGLCRPSPAANPTALLFEYPLYGPLHSFLTCKRRGSISNNASLWAGLEYQSLEPSILRSPPESSRKFISTLLSNYSLRSHPFMAPLNESLCEVDVLLFALQISGGIDFLDSSGIIHKNLTTENIIIGTGFYLKLSGFVSGDLPAAHRHLSYTKQQRTQTGRHMMRWRAPEVMECKEHTTMSEVWRYGMVLWEICSLGDTPLAHLPARELADSIKKGAVPPLPENCSSDL